MNVHRRSRARERRAICAKAKFQNTKGRAVLDVWQKVKKKKNNIKTPMTGIYHTWILYIAKLWITCEARVKTFSSWQDLKNVLSPEGSMFSCCQPFPYVGFCLRYLWGHWPLSIYQLSSMSLLEGLPVPTSRGQSPQPDAPDSHMAWFLGQRLFSLEAFCSPPNSSLWPWPCSPCTLQRCPIQFL